MLFEWCVSTPLRSCNNFSWHWDKGVLCHLRTQQWSLLISSLCPKLRNAMNILPTNIYYDQFCTRYSCVLWITPRFEDPLVSSLCSEILNLISSRILVSDPKTSHISPGKSSGFSCKCHFEPLGNMVPGGLIQYVNILELTKLMTNIYSVLL